MEEKDNAPTASHYFKVDQKSDFDDISSIKAEPKYPEDQDKNTNIFIQESKLLSLEPKQDALPGVVQEKIYGENNSNQPCFDASISQFNFITESKVAEEIAFYNDMSNNYLDLGHSNYLSTTDFTYDAWIPSQKTKDILNNLQSSPPGTFTAEKSNLTIPGIVIKEEFGDPVKNLVQTYLGEEMCLKRQAMTSSSVTQDNRGVRQLISNGCYHAAVNLTTQLLTVYGQGEGRAGQPSKHTAHSIQLWFTRLALLIKLRRFSLAEVECEPFRDLDAPDLYFEYYPELYGGRKGSMVPFAFRLLVATLPQYLGKHLHALDRLSKILTVCKQILVNLEAGLSEDGTESFSKGSKEEAIKLWKSRKIKVLYALTNCAVSFKDLRLASVLLQTLLIEDSECTSSFYSALGRICLHLGDIPSAQEAFRRYLECCSTGVKHDPVQGLIHSAFIACAKNEFQEATQILQQAHKLSPANPLVINNLAVCLMFLGKIRDAIQLVEIELFKESDKLLHEALVLNLCTMYELESSNAHRKKLHLLSLVSAHKGDGFNIEKITSSFARLCS